MNSLPNQDDAVCEHDFNQTPEDGVVCSKCGADGPTAQCPSCDGGQTYAFSTEDDPDPVKCSTCDGTGQVYEYAALVSSCGGASIECRVVGHRPASQSQCDFLSREVTNALGLLTYVQLHVLRPDQGGGGR